MAAPLAHKLNTPLGRDEARATQLARPLTWALGLSAALVVAPVAFAIVQGVAGLVVAGAIGMAGVQLAPVFALKLANWRLRLMQGEARGSPLPTLENLLLDRRTALTQASFQLQSAIAQIDAFVDQAGEYARRHPDAAPRWLERARRAEQMRAQKKRALRTAAESDRCLRAGGGARPHRVGAGRGRAGAEQLARCHPW